MSAWPGHLAISASAGTGKTYQLAHRFIKLVMLGESAERIVALTFSRKAAREIFDRVIQYLADAASSEQAASVRSMELDLTALTRADFCRALRAVLEALPRSRVGTIDSFTVGIVRAFPYELGIEPEFQLFDNGGIEARRMRGDALRHVLRSAATRDTERAELFEAFKYATFGNEEKSTRRVLDELMELYQSIYRIQPDGTRWGLAVPARDGHFASRDTWMEGVEELNSLVSGFDWPEPSRKFWVEFFAELREWRPEGALGKRTEYMLEKLVPEYASLGRAPVSITVNRKNVTVDVPFGEKLKPVLAFLADETIRLLSIRTHGLHRLVETCERVYDETVRRRGFLTFEDALFALYQHAPISGETSHGDPRRLAIDYRLDCRLDHWLLDEFQDTSTMQWLVMSNLIDEVVQDAEKRRTFFYVGDVKQAIYGWRGGNASLFQSILERYNRGGAHAIEQKWSNTSYRSCASVIDTVNRVFGDLSQRVSGEVRERWSGIWREHRCAPSVPASGYAVLIELPKPDASERADSAAGRLTEAARIVAELDPVRRGLSVAVLCRSGDRAIEMAATMRAAHPDIAVSLEGSSRIADNPAVAVLLAVLTLAEHPGDTFAKKLLQMSPLAMAVGSGKSSRASIQERGFHPTLAEWAHALQSAVSLTAYEEMRVAELLDLAAQADRQSSREIDRFVEYIREAAVEDAMSRNSVRIMTIHKAKGLDFDAVILPDLQSAGGRGSAPMISIGPDGITPEWILQPARTFVSQLDSRLRECRDTQEHQAEFEDLCVLYVAMTRAKRALYLVTTDQGPNSKAHNHAALLKEALGGEPDAAGRIYNVGDPNWYAAFTYRVEPFVEMPEAETLAFNLPADDRAVPSASAEFERDAGDVFSANMQERRKFGSDVHNMFEQIDWEGSIDRVIESARVALSVDVVDHVRRCLAEDTIRALFRRPDGNVRLWREQPFEIMLGGKWVSGTFDRVVIRLDATDRPMSAEVIDYKTNRIDRPDRVHELTEHYRSQLNVYRDVLQIMLGLPANQVKALLVFTDARQVVEITPDKRSAPV